MFRNGLIQFKADITKTVNVKVVTLKGGIIHTGVCIPAENAMQQYRLPLSLPVGYYLLSLNEKNGKCSIHSFMIMK